MDSKKDGLVAIVGKGNVLDDMEAIEAYSRDQSFVLPRKPRFVVKPKNTAEVQGIVKWANQTATPLVPVSSGTPHFRGDTVPMVKGAVVVDLSNMKRVIRIDRRNRIAMIEPGVTFKQLQLETAKEGLKISMPLLPRQNKSVVASLLEREPTLIPKYQWTLLEPLRCVEVIWGDGSKLWTGDSGPWGSLERQWSMGHAQVMPLGWAQTDFYRLLSGAQGTMGIVTWATVKLEVLPQEHKVLFIVANELENLIEFAYKILRIRYGDEFLFLNSSNLARIMTEKGCDISTLQQKIPSWILMIAVAGRERMPKERVKYQESDIVEIASSLHLTCSTSLSGVDNRNILDLITRPSPEPYWKTRHASGCEDIFFLTTLERLPNHVKTMQEVSQKFGYPGTDIGVYIQPVNRGVGCQCEFNLPYNMDNEEQAERARRLSYEASQRLSMEKAFFSRPYGTWAEMAYRGDPQTVSVLRNIKQVFDPHNVMNPGKLCFDTYLQNH